MSDIIEGLGTAAEGGLLARAAAEQPGGTGPLDKGHFAEGECLNCGTVLTGKHCHGCGQKAHLHRTLTGFMHDVAHGAVHFDGKTWRTLPMLAFKPGELTRRYVEGERTRFVSPMALFLFSIFLMFAVFQFAGISAPADLRGDSDAQIRELAGGQVERLTERRGTLVQRAADPQITEAQRTRSQAQLKEVEDQLAALRVAQTELPFLRAKGEPEPEGEATGETDASSDEADTAAANGGVSTDLTSSSDSGDWNFDPEETSWIKEGAEKWEKNPGLMLYKLQTNFYKFSWLLIPLSIPFVWGLFFWKRRFRAYDHAIFVTYSLSFMTLVILGIVLAGLAGAPTGVVVFASLLIPPIHIYMHLRGAYSLSRLSSLWRLAVLTFLIVFVLGLFTSLLMLVGLF